MLNSNLAEDAAKAEAHWLSKLPAETNPGIDQFIVWVRSCGLEATITGTNITEWKLRKSTEEGTEFTANGMHKYCSAVTKKKSLELGYVRCYDTFKQFEAPEYWQGESHE